MYIVHLSTTKVMIVVYSLVCLVTSSPRIVHLYSARCISTSAVKGLLCLSLIMRQYFDMCIYNLKFLCCNCLCQILFICQNRQPTDVPSILPSNCLCQQVHVPLSYSSVNAVHASNSMYMRAAIYDLNVPSKAMPNCGNISRYSQRYLSYLCCKTQIDWAYLE